MNIFNHNLSEETLTLLNEILSRKHVKLVISNHTDWFLENARKTDNRFHFNPMTDDTQLFLCLSAVNGRDWL